MVLQAAKDYGSLATNYLLWLSNMGQISQNVTIDKLNPAAQRNFLTEYRLSLGLTAESLPSAKGFQAYVSKRPTSAADFSTLKEAVASQLKSTVPGAPEAAKAVQKEIEDALQLTAATQAAQKAFETEMSEMRQLVEGVDRDDFLKNLEALKAAITDPTEQAKVDALIAQVNSTPTDEKLDSHALRTELAKLKPLAADDEKRTAVIRQAQLMDAKFHPQDLLRSLEESKQTALAALKAQQAAAVAALEAKFTNTDFKENLKTTLGITDAEIDSTKASMLADLTKAHDKEYAAFEKSVNDPISKMHRAAQKERDRVAFLATLYANDKAVKAEIDALYEKNKGAGHVSVSFSDKTNRALFKGVKIEDLHSLRTITGRPIKMGKNPDGSLAVSIQLPHRFFSSSYYFSSRNNIKADMLSVIGAVRAAGHEKITGNITHKSPEHALVLAREAYEAALESGFDEKNITIKVNGEVKTPAQLFADCPSRLEAAKEKATQSKAEREKVDSSESNDVTYGRFRKALKEGRLAEESAQEAQVAPPVGPILGAT